MHRQIVRHLLFGVMLAVGTTTAFAQAPGNEASRGAPMAAPRPAANPAPRIQRASRIIGMDVLNRQGEKIGDVEDLLLDTSGRVAYAVVSTGAYLGVRNRLHAIPWQSLSAGPADRLVVDVDRDRLRQAPGFDAASFPNVNDAKWTSENAKYFAPSSSMAPASAMANGTSPGRPAVPGGDIGPSNAKAARQGAATERGTTGGETQRSVPVAGEVAGQPVTPATAATGRSTLPATAGGTSTK